MGNALINDCYAAASRGFALRDHAVHGAVPTGAAGSCVAGSVALDPMLADPAGGDFHPHNPAAASCGAYAP